MAAASLGAPGLWGEAHACLVEQLLPAIALSGAREEARGARALLLRLQQAAEAGGAAAVPGWACGGRVYLLYFETLEVRTQTPTLTLIRTLTFHPHPHPLTTHLSPSP